MTANIRQFAPVVWTAGPKVDTIRQFAPVVWTQPPGQVQVRQAIAHTLQPTAPGGLVRQAVVHALQPQRKNPTLAGTAAIIALINSETVTPFTLSNLTLGTPTVNTSISGTNTALQLTALPASGYIGTYQIHYNRVSLFKQFASTAWLLPTISASTTIRALVPQINAAYGTYIDPTDVVDGPVAAGATSLQLVVASGSYVYQPGTNVNLPTLSLAAVTPNVNLAGFDNAAGVGPNNAKTVSLLHFDGANGGTTFTDVKGKVWTVTAPAALSNVQSKFGGTSYFNNGVGNISTPDSTDLQITGDGTIEFFMFGTLSSAQVMVNKSIRGARIQYDSGFIEVYTDQDNGGAGNAGLLKSSTAAVKLNQWQHIAAVKHNNVWTLYVDGAVAAQATSTNTWGVSANPLLLGSYWSNGNPMAGYMDEFRFSQGAQYTGPFTPPTAPFFG